MRGYESETDYRDTVMLSDFGFDADGIKRYDIGGTIIEVSLDGNLAPVIYDAKAKKVLVFKKIRRKGFQKLNGHRQKLTKIRIDSIA